MAFTRAHRTAYHAERSQRWTLEHQASRRIVSVIHSTLADTLGLPHRQISFRRFDEDWFRAFPPATIPWVRGCPDYWATLWTSPLRFLFLELKIKERGVFRKTITGGVTRSGSLIASYHCPSFYLDIDPVFANMMAFCTQTGLDPRHVLVAFAKPSASAENIHLITLREIQLLIRDGWHGTRLQEFDEGYGHRTYLIPQDATHPLIAATRLALLQWCTVSYVLPRFLQDA